MAIIARVAPAPVVHASATRVRSRAARRGAILVPRAEGKASAKDVDWDAKTKELTAERIMEQCMEAMADGDEERLQECLLELEDPEETKQVIEKVSSKTDDEFWKAKLAEIAAERVLENCMSAVVRPHAARGRNRSRATTRATPKAKVSVARRISPNQRDPTTTDFFSPIPAPSPSRVRSPATRTRSRRACSTPTTTRSSGWTSPPRRTGPRPSVSRRRVGAECWWTIAHCKTTTQRYFSKRSQPRRWLFLGARASRASAHRLARRRCAARHRSSPRSPRAAWRFLPASAPRRSRRFLRAVRSRRMRASPRDRPAPG